ncbi:hypothetical protein [Catenulispora rubra]|uniref:hypothetical protein n=1 Tax=Catenulispora rubra TaxID=280293 RepID=UPI0018925685|nr:hypothetical protein [Catenulispora rubra]
MNTDPEWARELFERSRQGEEPAWVADHTEMMRTGQRRNRVRALAASGSVLATAAAVAAVGIGVAGGADRRTPEPTPGTSVASPTKTAAAAADPAKVLDYASFDGFSTKDGKGSAAGFFKNYYIAVSATTAHDTMRLLSTLDPTLEHIAKTTPIADRVRLVPDTDPMAQDMAELKATVLWTESGLPASALQPVKSTAPTGMLLVSYVDSAKEKPAGQATCVTDGDTNTDLLHPVKTSGDGWMDAAQWSPCTKSTLPDGSTLLSSTKSYGPYVVTDVARKFPGTGGEVVMEWHNYADILERPTPGGSTVPPQPDPKRLLSGNPVTADKLVAALSDAGLTPPMTPVPVTAPSNTPLQPFSFGPGWKADPAGSHGSTATLAVEDGCVNEQHAVASKQPILGYAGTTPSGIQADATVAVDIMGAGSGPHWMDDLRRHGTGGCDTAAYHFSLDTMSPVPAGTGDDAFIENWYGQDRATIFIRFGDDIMRVDVSASAQNQHAFTQADKAWFVDLATRIAARLKN